MGSNELKFSTAETEDVYLPIEIVSNEVVDGSQIIKISDFNEYDVENIGIYLSRASNVGDVNNPADYSPHIDYQQILTWGTEGSGGLTVYYPTTDSFGTLVKRGVGSSLKTKIPLGTIIAGETLEIKVEFSVPMTVTARRLFVNISVG